MVAARYGAWVPFGSRPLAAAVAACALVLASCGGGSGDDGGARYVERVNAAQQAFAKRVDELSAGVTSTSSAERDRRTLQGFQQAVDDVGGDLRRIRPPTDLQALHDRLVSAVDGYGKEVEQAADTLRSSRSPAKLRSAQRELAQATTAFGTTLNRTIEEINRELNG
jgi:hypothetical protein